MGHTDWDDCRVKAQGAGAGHACHVHQGYSSRPARHKEHLRMSSVQDQVQRTNICLDLQPQDKGEGKQMDSWRCGSSAASLGMSRDIVKHLHGFLSLKLGFLHFILKLCILLLIEQAEKGMTLICFHLSLKIILVLEQCILYSV